MTTTTFGVADYNYNYNCIGAGGIITEGNRHGMRTNHNLEIGPKCMQKRMHALGQTVACLRLQKLGATSRSDRSVLVSRLL